MCPSIEVTGGAGVSVHGDLDMLRAALLNVLMNACQAAGSGPVDVAISIESGSCCLAVRDRGPGIPADARDRVFEPFFTTRAGGTGLGLAIVKRLLDLHDGSIRLKVRSTGCLELTSTLD